MKFVWNLASDYYWDGELFDDNGKKINSIHFRDNTFGQNREYCRQNIPHLVDTFEIFYCCGFSMRQVLYKSDGVDLEGAKRWCETWLAERYIETYKKALANLEKAKAHCDFWKEYFDEKEREKGEKSKSFVPYLKHRLDSRTLYGEVGMPTNYKDVTGEKLFVGDTVILCDESHRYPPEERVVVYSDELYGDKKVWILMGWEHCYYDAMGIVGNGYRIIKNRSYKDMKHGEVVGFVKYILEEEKGEKS